MHHIRNVISLKFGLEAFLKPISSLVLGRLHPGIAIIILAILGLCHADGHPNNIFLLAGQSNMVGRGGVINGTWDTFVPPECRPNPSIFQFTINKTWEEAKEPLHRDIDNKTCGVGPGMAFANSVLQWEPLIGSIGLVPCAQGGTSIEKWKQGNFLYNRTITRARASTVGGGVMRAMLWYQGESDTNNYQNASAYHQNLKKFLNDVRTDLMLPTLPIIQVALASGGKYVEIVRKAQLGFHLPNVQCVDAMGLKLKRDYYPVSGALGEEIGACFSSTLLGLCNNLLVFCLLTSPDRRLC